MHKGAYPHKDIDQFGLPRKYKKRFVGRVSTVSSSTAYHSIALKLSFLKFESFFYLILWFSSPAINFPEEIFLYVPKQAISVIFCILTSVHNTVKSASKSLFFKNLLG